MRSGDLNRRIRIEQESKTQDAVGGVSRTWSTVATVWASIEPLNGREYFEAKTTNQEITTRFRIRYRTGLDESMRIVDPETNLIYDIDSIIHFRHGNRELVIMAMQTNDEATA